MCGIQREADLFIYFYFISSSGDRTHNQSSLQSHLCPCATTGLTYNLQQVQIKTSAGTILKRAINLNTYIYLTAQLLAALSFYTVILEARSKQKALTVYVTR